MTRFLSFIKLILILIVIMYLSWFLSSEFLPQGILQGYFSQLFAMNPILAGKFTFWRIFLVNFIIAFLGIQFMNLFRVGKYPGGIYVLPLFWILYGILLGTNSFIYAADANQLSVSILWTRSGFNELLAYTFGFEASRSWALWKQNSFWSAERIINKKWEIEKIDYIFWIIGFILLVIAVIREVNQ